MSRVLELAAPAATRPASAGGGGLNVAVGPENPAFAVPARHNPRLQALVERINADEELRQLWRCANVNALDRLGLSDHGEVHVRIVANAALRLLRLLRDAGRAPGIVAHHHLAAEDAEVLVVLAAALHDVGLAVQPNGRPEAGLALASLKAKELLASLYSPRERTILVVEALQAIASHHHGGGLTLEAGVLHLGDALDLAEARLHPAAEREPGAARQRPDAPAAGVQAVTIHKGARLPIRVEVRLSDPASAPEVGRLLQRRLQEAGLADLVEVATRANGRPGMQRGPNGGEAREP